MSYLVIDDVDAYTPPENTSLIYSENGAYKYKTSAGATGNVAANVLPLLAVELTDIPCLVFTEDLTAALAKSIASTDNLTVALSNKGTMTYVAEVAKRKVDKTDFLSALSRTGEAIDQNTSALTAETTARSNADTALSGRLDTVEAAVPTKVDKVTGSSLVADTEISKLSEYPAYATVQAAIEEKQTAAQVSAAIAEVIADYYTGTQVDTKIASAVASVFKYMGALSDYSDLPASDAAGLAIGHVYHVGTKDNKTVNAEYAWNGSAWEELGSIIDLSAYYTAAQVDSAISAAIAQEVSDRNAAIATVSAVAEGLDGRLTTAEGEIDTLQAATAGYDGTNTVAAAISAAQSAAESTAAADATSKANAAETAAKSYADGLDSAMDARVTFLKRPPPVSMMSPVSVLRRPLLKPLLPLTQLPKPMQQRPPPRLMLTVLIRPWMPAWMSSKLLLLVTMAPIPLRPPSVLKNLLARLLMLLCSLPSMRSPIPQKWLFSEAALLKLRRPSVSLLANGMWQKLRSPVRFLLMPMKEPTSRSALRLAEIFVKSLRLRVRPSTVRRILAPSVSLVKVLQSMPNPTTS